MVVVYTYRLGGVFYIAISSSTSWLALQCSRYDGLKVLASSKIYSNHNGTHTKSHK